nr:ribosomal protein AT-L30 {N-terminal} [Actinomadura atramentaria, JCM 6250T, Peptide Partial, 20 aa] [Actinomadura atramentaria]
AKLKITQTKSVIGGQQNQQK